jgi:hypothetical protein
MKHIGNALALFVLGLFILSLQAPTTNAALTRCINQPVTLNWSSSNVSASGCTLTPNSNNQNCNFTPFPDTSGSRIITLSSGSCSVSLTCGTASASDTLTIDTTQTWNGTACVPNSCANGANNPPTCSTCTAPLVWNGSSCVSSSCTNGANNPPTCNTCTAPLVWNGSSCTNPAVNGACSPTHYLCSAGTSTNNVNGASAYTWTCAGTNGGTSASCSEAKTVAPTASLSGSPLTIAQGQSATLSWSSTNATSCTAAGGFSTGSATSGSASTGALSSTQSYQVSCTGAGGTANSNIVTITVTNPTVTITAGPDRVLPNGTTTISWNASSVNSCTISKNGVLWKSRTADASHNVVGSATDTITGQTSYVITCANTSGSTSAATKIVNVVQNYQEF